jgi:hypothetical protein
MSHELNSGHLTPSLLSRSQLCLMSGNTGILSAGSGDLLGNFHAFLEVVGYFLVFSRVGHGACSFSSMVRFGSEALQCRRAGRRVGGSFVERNGMDRRIKNRL